MQLSTRALLAAAAVNAAGNFLPEGDACDGALSMGCDFTQ